MSTEEKKTTISESVEDDILQKEDVLYSNNNILNYHWGFKTSTGISIPSENLDNISRIKIIKGTDRRTSDILSQYELTQLIGTREKSINEGCQYYTDVSGLTTAESKILKEIDDRKCPYNIIRYIGKNVAEVFSANEMTYIE